MDLATLRQTVESAVRGKLASGESFTTVDISHPLISGDPAVNHRDVRKIISEIQSRGEISAAGYTTSRITVEPKPGQTAVARLFHHASVDPASYTATQQELNRGQSPVVDTTQDNADATKATFNDFDTDNVRMPDTLL